MKDHAGSSARLAGLFVALMLIAAPQAVQAAQGGVPGRPGAEVTQARHHDKSLPLRDIAPAPPKKEREAEKRVKELPLFMGGMFDPVVQVSKGAAQAPTLGAGFEGVGQGFSGPNGTFSVNSAPPDTNGAVGPNHFVQIVNLDGPIGNVGLRDVGDRAVVIDRVADAQTLHQRL